MRTDFGVVAFVTASQRRSVCLTGHPFVVTIIPHQSWTVARRGKGRGLTGRGVPNVIGLGGRLQPAPERELGLGAMPAPGKR